MSSFWRKRIAIFKASKGFTLVEMALVVAVLSAVGAGGTGVYNLQAKREQVGVTKQRLTDIRAALVQYKTKIGHLPCPAPMDAAPMTATFGKSDTANCTAGAAQAGTVRVGAAGSTVRIGAVPVVDLGLPLETLTDKWGNRFIYAVSEKLADGTVSYDENNGAITLMGDGAAVLGPVAGKTPLVVISPGADMAGGTSYEGKALQTACPASGPEKDNCDNTDAVFRAASFSLSSNATLYFDDMLINSIGSNDPATVCGDMGMFYGPKHPKADASGCVAKIIQDPVTGHVGIWGAPTSGATLDVAGEVKISKSGSPCNSNLRGSLRYNSITSILEYCDGGSAWKTLIGIVGPKGPLGDAGATGAVGDKGATGPKGDAGTCITCIADHCAVGCPDTVACGQCGNAACPPPPECPNGACGAGENCNTCPDDCGACPPPPDCPNGACGAGENCSTCPDDCGACPPPPGCPNGACGAGENCSNCPDDCGACPPPPDCPNGACGAGENCSNCPDDCGACPPPPDCPNGACGAGESCNNCPDDCGACPPPPSCPNGACGAGESCNNCPDDCGVCPPPPECPNGACGAGENCNTCPDDCGACPPPPSCPNGACGAGESCNNCPDDCGACPPPPSCPNGACGAGENCNTCPDDCGACPPPPSCPNGACGAGEGCNNCPDDCGACPPPPSCPNGACSAGENCSTCPDDCGTCGPCDIDPVCCGDLMCQCMLTCTSFCFETGFGPACCWGYDSPPPDRSCDDR